MNTINDKGKLSPAGGVMGGEPPSRNEPLLKYQLFPRALPARSCPNTTTPRDPRRIHIPDVSTARISNSTHISTYSTYFKPTRTPEV